MNPGGRDRLEELLESALEQEPEARSRFLSDACPDDPALRAEAEAILAGEADAGPFDRLFGIFSEPLPDSYVDGITPGERVGFYVIDRLLGRGGMGSVFLARRADGQFEQDVAIKILRFDAVGAEPRRHFLAERQILAGLSHPNIARVFNGGVTAAGRPYLVMEYVEGTRIDRYCDERRMAVRERLLLFMAVCDAVHYAHRNLVVHRDLKPGNILVTADGRPKLLDFGVAKLLAAEEDDEAITRTEWLPITPDYASPEQVRGDPITTATDVYALGILLYELLSGHRPHRFARRSPAEILRVLDEVEMPPPSAAVAAVQEGEGAEGGTTGNTRESVGRARGTDSRMLERRLKGDLDTIVLKALRREPERRYGGAAELAADIRRHLDGHPVEARPDTRGYRLAKFVRRNRAAVAVAAITLLSLAAIAGTLAVQAHRIARERNRADRVAGLLFFRRDPQARPGGPGSSAGRDTGSLAGEYCLANPALAPDEQTLTPEQQRLLQRAREAVEHIRTVADANAAGYFRAIAGCVSSGPTGRGAIGVAYLNARLASDGILDVTRPEVLEFEPQADGTDRLIGVFYTYDVGFQPPFPPPPSLFGVTFDGPLVQRSTGVVFYGLHVSLFEENPNGIFHPYNPELTCEYALAGDTTVLESMPCWRSPE